MQIFGAGSLLYHKQKNAKTRILVKITPISIGKFFQRQSLDLCIPFLKCLSFSYEMKDGSFITGFYGLVLPSLFIA
jgi:hypothetical protein